MNQLRKRYLLDNYWLVPDEQLLSRGEQPIHLSRKPFQVLVYLIENRDRFVSRTELLDSFWEGKDVYDDALRKSIGAIRKALDDQTTEPRFIETRWGVGYHFIGPVEEQIVREESAITEIERTRGVKIVFEEEEIHDETSMKGASAVGLARQSVFAWPARRLYARILIIVLASLSVTLGAAALFSYRRGSGATTDRRASVSSIAVLPLRNLTGNPSNDYLSDGVTESLITALSKVQGLKVMSRGSILTFKGKDVDALEAGKSLNVATILEGSVRQSGDQVRVDVRLVSTSDGEVLWASDSYDRSLRDIFVIQDEIARSVTNGLRIKLSSEGGQRLEKRYTDSFTACFTSPCHPVSK